MTPGKQPIYPRVGARLFARRAGAWAARGGRGRPSLRIPPARVLPGALRKGRRWFFGVERLRIFIFFAILVVLP